MVVEASQKDFRDIQNEYDQLFKHDSVRDEDRAYAWFARIIKKLHPKTKAILDLACGAGYFPRELYRNLNEGIQVTGVDISGEALRLAQKECPQGKYAMSVAEDLPFGSEVFDAITCLGSMEHFLDIPQAISEMKRVLKRDGLVLILVPNIFWYKDILAVFFTGTRKTRNQTHERFSSFGEWIEIIEKSGLSVVKTMKYNGIAKSPIKQWFKDLLIPKWFSYHFIYICKVS